MATQFMTSEKADVDMNELKRKSEEGVGIGNRDKTKDLIVGTHGTHGN